MGGRHLQKMLPHLKALTALGQLAQEVFIDIRINGDSEVDLKFFMEHDGHPIVVRSEYGYNFGDCGKWVDETLYDVASHHYRRCTLTEGHEGPCG
jgi:hypothetical protein